MKCGLAGKEDPRTLGLPKGILGFLSPFLGFLLQKLRTGGKIKHEWKGTQTLAILWRKKEEVVLWGGLINWWW